MSSDILIEQVGKNMCRAQEEQLGNWQIILSVVLLISFSHYVGCLSQGSFELPRGLCF